MIAFLMVPDAIKAIQDEERILMSKINLCEELLVSQIWPKETENAMRSKLENYRVRLSEILNKEQK